MKLYPHQQRFLDENHECHLLAYDTGLGKTYTSLMWAKKNNPQALLIICPKTIKEQWEDNIQEHIPHINTKVVTKEYFRDKFDKKQKIDAIIVDEAHVVASTTSKLHKEVKKYLKRHDVQYRLFLTATPVLSKGSMNIFALAVLLGHDITLARWRQEFMMIKKQVIRGGRIIMPWVDREDKETKDKLIRTINRMGTLIEKGEVYEVPEQKEMVHRIPYTDELREKIKEEIDGEVEPIVMWTIKHRLEQTIKYDLVLDEVKKYKKVILVSRYLDDIAHYSSLLPSALVLTGKTTKRGELLKELNDREDGLIIVNSAISEGWEFPDCEAVIFSSLDFSLKNFIQMKGRSLRMNKPSETDIHIFVTKGGSDSNVYQSISNKKDFHVKMFLNNI